MGFLYIQRWLSADMQLEDGTKIKRLGGVPQGGVITPPTMLQKT